MRFKTSATYLRTLFPTPSFRFASPATVAQASFQCTQLDGLEWLGGRGYNHFGLWIHGVEYVRKDGSTVSGSFLPIMFEDLADPIVTGREELGMPKAFCDIDVAKRGGSTTVNCSWRGTSFASMVLEGLEEAPDKPNTNGANGHGMPPGPPDNGLLVYRYVPAVGKPGIADAEYPVFVSNDGATTQRVVEKTHRAATGSVKIQRGDWDSLPTLHHIVSGLAEVPVYEVLEAKTEVGRGVEDLSQAKRVE
ncbi:acetoacetate decarboxylase family protein [Candidatus Bathyarchaeota archaeon]|nr:acetoacetate decarboxylase family protein [Candidatus Bathyarchaeota archaeon]